MAQVTLKGNPIQTCGELPAAGSSAPQFQLVNKDLGLVELSSFSGKRLVLSVFPSVDTPTCAQSVRTFNEKAASLDNTAVLCISRDLPFAQSRFCAAEGIENVITLSEFRNDQFGTGYGVTLVDGPLEGLFARALVVIDESGKVLHTELVPEIADEPNYAAALSALS